MLAHSIHSQQQQQQLQCIDEDILLLLSAKVRDRFQLSPNTHAAVDATATLKHPHILT